MYECIFKYKHKYMYTHVYTCIYICLIATAFVLPATSEPQALRSVTPLVTFPMFFQKFFYRVFADAAQSTTAIFRDYCVKRRQKVFSRLAAGYVILCQFVWRLCLECSCCRDLTRSPASRQFLCHAIHINEL